MRDTRYIACAHIRLSIKSLRFFCSDTIDYKTFTSINRYRITKPHSKLVSLRACVHFQSVSSGSLLLSAAHLARMNDRNSEQDNLGGYPNKLSSYGRKSALAEAVVAIPEESHDPLDSMWNGVKRSSASGRDAASVASSTHFTVVNGYTKHRVDKEPTSCCCNHSHQITVLVISMTILFSACILAAICFVESEYQLIAQKLMSAKIAINVSLSTCHYN